SALRYRRTTRAASHSPPSSPKRRLMDVIALYRHPFLGPRRPIGGTVAACAPEDGDREERHGQERHREAEDGQVGSGPMQAEAFAEPERPETADEDADRKLQRVLRDAGQRPA